MNQNNQNIISSLKNLSSACETLKTDETFLKKYNDWIKNLISTISNDGTIFICGTLSKEDIFTIVFYVFYGIKKCMM